jgi:hypothetical protein
MNKKFDIFDFFGTLNKGANNVVNDNKPVDAMLELTKEINAVADDYEANFGLLLLSCDRNSKGKLQCKIKRL